MLNFGSPVILLNFGSPVILLNFGSPVILLNFGCPVILLNFGSPVIFLNFGSPFILLNFQMAARFILLTFSGSKKNEPRYTCLCEAKDSHSQRTWAEVSSSAPHLLHSGLSDSPIR